MMIGIYNNGVKRFGHMAAVDHADKILFILVLTNHLELGHCKRHAGVAPTQDKAYGPLSF